MQEIGLAYPEHSALQIVLAIRAAIGASMHRRHRPAGRIAQVSLRCARDSRRSIRHSKEELMPSSQRSPLPCARRLRGAIPVATALVVIAPAIAAADDVAPFTVALPTVTGPIPSTPDNFGFAVE